MKKIISVVASTYELNESAFAAPEGITELIETTNELMPEGIKAGEKDVAEFKLNRKRALAQSVIGVATTSAAVVGAVPIPIADAAILAPLETAEINAIAKIYGIKNDEKSRQFFNSIVEVGTVSLAAKTVISTLKALQKRVKVVTPEFISDYKQICGELGRFGNNINQIAKYLNSTGDTELASMWLNHYQAELTDCLMRMKIAVDKMAA